METGSLTWLVRTKHETGDPKMAQVNQRWNLPTEDGADKPETVQKNSKTGQGNHRRFRERQNAKEEG